MAFKYFCFQSITVLMAWLYIGLFPLQACEEKMAEELLKCNPCYILDQDLEYVNTYIETHKLVDTRKGNLAHLNPEDTELDVGIAFESYNTPSSLYESLVRSCVFTGEDLKHPQMISASLHFPPEIHQGRKVPAMVLSPGGTSIEQIPHSRKKFITFLRDQGYACFIIDHFTLRKIQRTTDNELMPSDLSCLRDAFQGLKLLATCPFIDISKISITGFSHGMLIADLASHLEYQQIMSPHDKFAAHFMFYPLIIAQEIKPKLTGAPLYYFAGKDDDLTPPFITEHYVQHLKKHGYQAEIFIYEGVDENDKVRHGFNVPEFDGRMIDFMNWLYEQYCAWHDYPWIKGWIAWIANRLAGLQDSPGFQEIENLKDACYLYDENGFWPFPKDHNGLSSFYQLPGKQEPWAFFAAVMVNRMRKGGHLRYNKTADESSLGDYSKILARMKN